MSNSPCLDCGACCACYRVSFYWREVSELEVTGVPLALTEKLNHHRMVMLGTNQKSPHCIALQGEIGVAVNCSIYDRRPSPCREFEAGTERCREARNKHGLADLEADWEIICA